MARYKGRPLGGLGALGAISFHETKNIISGEGGALLVSDARYQAKGYASVFHYVPLHSSPAGRRFGRISSVMTVTDDVADRVLRLPLWVGLPRGTVEAVVETLISSLRGRR